MPPVAIGQPARSLWSDRIDRLDEFHSTAVDVIAIPFDPPYRNPFPAESRLIIVDGMLCCISFDSPLIPISTVVIC
jgi:hypothetical protein